MESFGEALWVPVDDVLDHPANPRDITKCDIDNLVSIIQKHGFLVPLTVVRHGEKKYMITSGHRRKAAAQKAGMREVPVFIKNATDEEGIFDLLLNGQLDHEEFTPYEWGAFLFTCWCEDGRPAITDQIIRTATVAGKQTDKDELQAVFYAFDHVPEHVWQKVRDDKISFHAIKSLAHWVMILENCKPRIIEEFGIKYTFESLLAKMERGLIKSSDLKILSVPMVASEQALSSLIAKPELSLGQLLEDLGYRTKKAFSETRKARNVLSKARSTLANVQPRDAREAEEAIRTLRLVLNDVRRAQSRLRAMRLSEPKDAQYGEVSEQVKDVVLSYRHERSGFTARDVNLVMPEFKISSIDTYLRKLVDKGVLTVADDVKPRRYFVSEEWRI